MSTQEVGVADGTGGNSSATPPSIIPDGIIPEGMAADLVAAWAELQNVHKSKTANAGTYTYSYADLGDLLDVARPILGKHGLALIQPLSRVESPVITIHTMLVHSSGDVLSWRFDVQGGGSPQQTGSAITYGRRYAAAAVLGVAYEGDDDDGKAAAATSTSGSSGPRSKVVDPDGPSTAQTRRAMSLFGQLELSDRKARLEVTSAILDRTVGSWNEVSRDEARQVIEALQDRVEDALAESADTVSGLFGDE